MESVKLLALRQVASRRTTSNAGAAPGRGGRGGAPSGRFRVTSDSGALASQSSREPWTSEGSGNERATAAGRGGVRHVVSQVRAAMGYVQMRFTWSWQLGNLSYRLIS